MSKKRIYELAKELNVSNKEVIEVAKKNGFKVGNHMSSLDQAAEAKGPFLPAFQWPARM